MKRKIEFYFYIVISKLLKISGLNGLRFFAKCLGNIFFYLVPIRKSTVLGNLKTAFPEWTEEKIIQIAKKNYLSFALTFLEIVYLQNFSREDILNYAVCENLSEIKERFSKGKGLIVLTAHYGNWELGALYMGLALNAPMTVLMKEQHNADVSEWLKQIREMYGNKVATLGASVRELYKTLLNGGMIGLVGDQRGPRDGTRVKFFDQNTSTHAGTAALAIKNNIPIIVAVVQRKDDHRYEIKVKEIELADLPSNKDEKIQAINQRYMSILEEYIREAPEQWFWMHKIWKY